MAPEDTAPCEDTTSSGKGRPVLERACSTCERQVNYRQHPTVGHLGGGGVGC